MTYYHDCRDCNGHYTRSFEELHDWWRMEVLKRQHPDRWEQWEAGAKMLRHVLHPVAYRGWIGLLYDLVPADTPFLSMIHGESRFSLHTVTQEATLDAV